MLNKLPELRETPSQTGGPYVHIGLTPNDAEIRGVFDTDLGSDMLTPETKGTRIAITGRIIDGAGAPVTDAVVEIWQADADGSYAGTPAPNSNTTPAFTGFGRKPTDGSGAFAFQTIKPGPVTGADGTIMAPHVTLWIAARGINIGLQTRLYFADEAEANAADPVLARVPEHRRNTLIAKSDGSGRYRLDIHLQGEAETVFFDI